MRLDPRRNLAATAAGILGVFLFALPWLQNPNAPIGPARLLLLVAGIASLLAGALPSRRVRFLLLLGAVPAFLIITILAMFSIWLPMLLVALVATYGLVVEYAREGRE
jgi:nitrate reductase NapE component